MRSLAQLKQSDDIAHVVALLVSDNAHWGLVRISTLQVELFRTRVNLL